MYMLLLKVDINSINHDQEQNITLCLASNIS